MTETTSPRLGGHVLADQLLLQGATKIFCVPGESYIALLDGLYRHQDKIQVIHTRHEAGAANMAEAYGKLTGKPGICMVTRGPGATNASIGIHTAMQDSTPMILLIGQIGRDMVDREAFQEVDYRSMYGDLAKWAAQIDDAARIPEYINHAYYMALSGRPGPVVLALPEDMLADHVTVSDLSAPAAPPAIAPSPQDMERFRDRLAQAERPVMIVGGPTWNPGAIADMAKFAEANGVPVAASFRSQDCFDNTHANYAGDVGIAINPKLAQRIKECDLLIVAGPRLGEMTTQGYDLINIPEPKQDLIHIQTGAEELGRVYRPWLGINATMPEFARAAATLKPVNTANRAGWVDGARTDYLERIKPPEVPGPVNPAEIVSWLSANLPDDAIVTVGAGNYTVWVHRFYQHRKFRTQLAPTSGAMGYSVPAAIAAKITEPDRVVVSFNGDGCFMMLGQELATAVQFQANVIFVIVNNSMLATIRMHQERSYPARVIGTDLQNPDFVKLADAYGALGVRVTKTEEFAPAFEAARQAGRPAIIEVILDPEALTPVQSLSEARLQGEKDQA